MQLTKIDLYGKFMTLVKADMHDGDEIEITKIYPNSDYKKNIINSNHSSRRLQ